MPMQVIYNGMRGGEISNGESKLANAQFFDTDKNFNLNEFFHFCSKMLKPEPKEKIKQVVLLYFAVLNNSLL